MTAPDILLIPARFNGPPRSANGGYVAGRLAACIAGPAKVDLRAPPPLDTPMEIRLTETGFAAWQNDTLIGTVQPGELSTPARKAPTASDTATGRSNFPPVEDHAFPTCFVCGPQREIGDGLRIFTGDTEEFDGVADFWTPGSDFADESGLVRDEIIWAALDCPGAFAVGFQDTPMVLASMTGEIRERPPADERLIVAGWSLYDDGRKHGAGTALYRLDGTCLAQSEQLWITLRK